jgi:hypothetical protein
VHSVRCGTERRKKTFAVTTRYDADEYAQLEEAASEAGLTRASYQRVQTLAAPKTRSTRRAPVEKELLGRLLGQIGKIASNLNQIARAANMGFGLPANFAGILRELRNLIPDILRALGRAPLLEPDDPLDSGAMDDYPKDCP